MSHKLCGIYSIRNKTSGMRYVGQSRDILDRWKRHRKGKDKNTLITNAIQKHGPEAFDWEIIVLCKPEELDDLESFFISTYGYGCQKPGGYNLCSGGQRVEFTEEVRDRHRKATQKLACDPNWREKQLAAVKKMAEDPAWRQSVSNGKKKSDATKRHLALLQSSPVIQERRTAAVRRASQVPERKEQLVSIFAGYWDCPKRKNAVAEANRKRLVDPRVWVLINTQTRETQTGTQYELRQRLGMSQSQINGLVRGERKTSKGFQLLEGA